MIINDAFLNGIKLLKENNIDEFQFITKQLIEKSCNLDKNGFYLNRFHEIKEDEKSHFDTYIARVISGEPLQYILCQWEFCSFPFKVGEGVLIPRPETELLVEKAVEFIAQKKSVVFDLCAGSGCVGISVAKLCPNSKVLLFEISDNAIYYLEQNIKLNEVKNATVVKWNIFNEYDFSKKADVILSNPPYIPTAEISSLQLQVSYEPKMALDGGENGFDFYKCINSKWSALLNKNGLLAVEHGDGQGEAVKKIFSDTLFNLQITNDFSNHDRIVTGYKK